MKKIFMKVISFIAAIESSKLGLSGKFLTLRKRINIAKHCRLMGIQHSFSISFGTDLFICGHKYIHIGKNVILGSLTRIEAVDMWRGQSFSPSIEIGNNAVINPLSHVGCINRVVIGNYVSIGERTYITDHVHGASTYEDLLMPPRHRPLFSKGPVIIEDYATIGENCCILPGVTIGHNSVIGANAVVTKSVPPFSIVGGNPAKVLKIISNE